ncbi:DUF1707 SHOCT-like domain-containing protein [Pseudonocardia nigra]|uniref:DUF1707 SHOCT-like domain-containing protein n=1 Tax=Pseudonocardia nigra TaxID=1921578 RepID=UPI001C6049DF|nr:DUF1707 domain-containing protein [Pseudonocardia nigra]
MGDEPSQVRIGTAERTAAMQALDEHLAAGRLDVEEYGNRSAVAANAAFASELWPLFTDLPDPHPELPGGPAVPPTAAVEPRPGSGFLDQYGPRLMTFAPVVAVLLFLVVRHWVVFLLVPLAWVLVSMARRGNQ